MFYNKKNLSNYLGSFFLMLRTFCRMTEGSFKVLRAFCQLTEGSFKVLRTFQTTWEHCFDIKNFLKDEPYMIGVIGILVLSAII
ncbi:MAG TPA: hypothetical protein PK218_09285 [Flavobacterium sp.]|nr:hypothetical protein [Flavobacterium sp.]